MPLALNLDIMQSSTSRSAFSLIEFSVVIIIIGLLIGSFMGAEEMINNAKLKQAKRLSETSPITEFTNDKLQLSALAWFDILDENNLTIESGKVTSWQSKISNHIMAQATASDQPSYLSDAYNGFPALDFDGSGVFLESNHIIAKGDDTYTLSAVTIVEDTQDFIFCQGEDAQGLRACIKYSSDSNAFGLNVKNGDAFSNSGARNKIFAVIITVANGAVNIYLNDQQITTAISTSLLNVSTEFTGLGSATGSESDSLNGQIFEAAIFDKALSEIEAKQLQNYYMSKYGIE